MFEFYYNLKNFYFNDFSMVISIIIALLSLIITIWLLILANKAKDEWAETQLFNKKLELLDEIKQQIKTFYLLCDKGYKNFNDDDKKRLEKLKINLKFLIIDFNIIFKNNEGNQLLEDHKNNIEKLLKGETLFRVTLQKAFISAENRIKEIEGLDNYFEYLICDIEKLYRELYEKHWEKLFKKQQ